MLDFINGSIFHSSWIHTLCHITFHYVQGPFPSSELVSVIGMLVVISNILGRTCMVEFALFFTSAYWRKDIPRLAYQSQEKEKHMDWSCSNNSAPT